MGPWRFRRSSRLLNRRRHNYSPRRKSLLSSNRQQQALTQQQIQQLVAPIALYPDALLAQVLTASTYPLEVTLASRWSEKNPNLKDAALEAQCSSSHGIQASRD